MNEYEEKLKVETQYLNYTLSVLKNTLEEEQGKSLIKKENLIASRRDMYENTAHASTEFDKLTEMVQHLGPIEVQTYDYEAGAQKIQQYEKMLKTPYFARIDFNSEEFEKESIYIGLGSVEDNDSFETLVYDWRAPISSVFYRYELGKVTYEAPCGTITGEVTLKRQYEIKKGVLQYFFDSSVNVMDDILKKVLSNNTSAKMKTIVETIQREQDMIIRDIENDLVIVQGVAGSGKTSVALHRIAFLMYRGIHAKLSTNNIALISPNDLFAQYISNVLPELGEKNVSTFTFEDIFLKVFEDSIKVKSKNSILESIITETNESKKAIRKASLEFKTSNSFLIILNRLIQYYQRHLIEFSDVYYDGQCIANRHLLKSELLDSQRRSISIQKRLAKIETRISKQIQELKKTRMEKLEKFVVEKTNHPFEIKAFARWLSSKQDSALMNEVYKFTHMDYLKLYKRIFADTTLFYKLSIGINLPLNITQILEQTKENLKSNELFYEDAMALLCLKVKNDGYNLFPDIKQVMVDEAQDYDSVHFQILKSLFPNAKYTILGDVNQTIQKTVDFTLYDRIKEILNKKTHTTIYMTKSFRCSYEINLFSTTFTDGNSVIESFDRHEANPTIIGENETQKFQNAIVEEINQCYHDGYASIAIVCKSMMQAKEIYQSIKDRIDVQLISDSTEDRPFGVIIIPVYMAKGLEFDAVLVYEVDNQTYKTEDDKKLLYIACTRALHRLSLFHQGQVCKFIEAYTGDLEKKGSIYKKIL